MQMQVITRTVTRISMTTNAATGIPTVKPILPTADGGAAVSGGGAAVSGGAGCEGGGGGDSTDNTTAHNIVCMHDCTYIYHR